MLRGHVHGNVFDLVVILHILELKKVVSIKINNASIQARVVEIVIPVIGVGYVSSLEIR